MPPKRREVESDSEEEVQQMGDMASLGRFTNPNYSREFLAGLTPEVRERAKGVLGLEKEFVARQKARGAARAELQRKYQKLYAPLMKRRTEIVNGAAVTEEEIKAGIPEDHAGKVSIEGKDDETDKPMTAFWLRALSHHCIIEEMITERDAEVLKHLRDIEVIPNTEEEGEGFSLKFVFEANDFFSESELVKQFFVKDEMGESVITSTKETKVNWKSDEKNPTVTTVTKKQKSKSKAGATRLVTKTEPCESFFHMFVETDDSEDAEQWYSLAETLKSKIIPLAVDYYTGEAPDGSSDIDDEEDEEDDEDYDDDEESEDDEPMPRGGRAGGRGRGGAAPGGKQGQDCKQQ